MQSDALKPTDRFHVGGLTAGGEVSFDAEDCTRYPALFQIPDVGELVPGKQGSAVRLSAILARAQADARARYANITSTDPDFAVSLGLDEIAECALIVYALDGRPLPASKGGPFRLLVPGHPDECVHVKSLARIELALAPGRDTRPTDNAEHAKLHAKKK